MSEMNLRTVYTPACSVCGRTHADNHGIEPCESAKEAIALAQKYGWRSVDGKTYCQPCHGEKVIADEKAAEAEAKANDPRTPIERYCDSVEAWLESAPAKRPWHDDGYRTYAAPADPSNQDPRDGATIFTHKHLDDGHPHNGRLVPALVNVSEEVLEVLRDAESLARAMEEKQATTVAYHSLQASLSNLVGSIETEFEREDSL
jgi:hypothetical protein